MSGNIQNHSFHFDQGNEEYFMRTETLEKLNNSSIFLDLTKANFPNTIKVSIFGIKDGQEKNCTNEGFYFNVEANHKYFLYNLV